MDAYTLQWDLYKGGGRVRRDKNTYKKLNRSLKKVKSEVNKVGAFFVRCSAADNSVLVGWHKYRTSRAGRRHLRLGFGIYSSFMYYLAV